MVRRDRRTRNMITGFLTALVWVCSLLTASVGNDATQREVARAFASTAPVVASNAPSLRFENAAPARHGTVHSHGADALASVREARSVAAVAQIRIDGMLPAPARHRIAPHDATAPPADHVSA